MYKFPVQVYKQVMLNLDKPRWAQMMSGLKDGDYEILVVKKVDWDITQMRRFFEGPVLDFFVKGYFNLGYGIYGKETVRNYLKAKFLGYDREDPRYRAFKMLDHYKHGTFITASTVDIKAYADTEKAMSEFGVTLPIKSSKMPKDDFWGFLEKLGGLSKEIFKADLPTINETNKE